MSLKSICHHLDWLTKSISTFSLLWVSLVRRVVNLRLESQPRLSVGLPPVYRINELVSEKKCDFLKELADTRGVQKQLTSNYSWSWGKGIE